MRAVDQKQHYQLEWPNGIPGKTISANAFEVLICSARALQSPKRLADAVREEVQNNLLHVTCVCMCTFFDLFVAFKNL